VFGADLDRGDTTGPQHPSAFPQVVQLPGDRRHVLQHDVPST
jgi:hypothetical protein